MYMFIYYTEVPVFMETHINKNGKNVVTYLLKIQHSVAKIE